MKQENSTVNPGTASKLGISVVYGGEDVNAEDLIKFTRTPSPVFMRRAHN